MLPVLHVHEVPYAWLPTVSEPLCLMQLNLIGQIYKCSYKDCWPSFPFCNLVKGKYKMLNAKWHVFCCNNCGWNCALQCEIRRYKTTVLLIVTAHTISWHGWREYHMQYFKCHCSAILSKCLPDIRYSSDRWIVPIFSAPDIRSDTICVNYRN